MDITDYLLRNTRRSFMDSLDMDSLDIGQQRHFLFKIDDEKIMEYLFRIVMALESIANHMEKKANEK